VRTSWRTQKSSSATQQHRVSANEKGQTRQQWAAHLDRGSKTVAKKGPPHHLQFAEEKAGNKTYLGSIIEMDQSGLSCLKSKLPTAQTKNFIVARHKAPREEVLLQ